MLRIISIITLISIAVLGIVSMAYSETYQRSTGIGFRGSYWTGNDTESQIIVEDYYHQTNVDIEGAGGWMSFYTRVAPNMMLEFSLGSMGKAETQSIDFFGEDVKAEAVTGALLGLHYELFPFRNITAFKPYLSAGMGPYWLSDINVQNRDFTDNNKVNIKTRLRGGGYTGAGMNFMFSNWFGLNFDIRYHFINFNPMHKYSGWDYGLGINFYWGEFTPIIK